MAVERAVCLLFQHLFRARRGPRACPTQHVATYWTNPWDQARESRMRLQFAQHRLGFRQIFELFFRFLERARVYAAPCAVMLGRMAQMQHLVE
jgi:hypothetical protein